MFTSPLKHRLWRPGVRRCTGVAAAVNFAARSPRVGVAERANASWGPLLLPSSGRHRSKLREREGVEQGGGGKPRRISAPTARGSRAERARVVACDTAPTAKRVAARTHRWIAVADMVDEVLCGTRCCAVRPAVRLYSGVRACSISTAKSCIREYRMSHGICCEPCARV